MKMLKMSNNNNSNDADNLARLAKSMSVSSSCFICKSGKEIDN